jgi:N utilization substance protein A
MNESSGNDEEVRKLYRKYAPDVAAGVVDVVAVAREPGQYTMVAVHSHDPSINPVSACVGKGAVITKSISRELGGGICVLSWSESLPEFIAHTMLSRGPGTSRTPRVTLDDATHQAHVRVEPETLDYMTSRDGLLLRLASRLVGWEIRLLPYDESPVA